MSRITDARVIRHGAAIEIHTSGGAWWTVRAIDLWPGESISLSDPALGKRFVGARASDDSVLIEYSDGVEEYVPARALRRPIARSEARITAESVSHLAADLVLENAGLLMTARARNDDDNDPLGLIPDGALIAGSGHVLWVGPGRELGASGLDVTRARRIDVGGRLLTPGLVDCHAHPIFAGERANEFAQRAAGLDYLAIAAAGGGISATVGPTRAASVDEHIALTSARMDRALAAGTTTIEAKSGYDLTVDGELRLLEIAAAVDGLHPMDLSPTLLGAHVVPPEYADDRDRFVRLVAEQMIPRAAQRGLTRTADVYCDQGAFTLDETRSILSAAVAAGLSARAHVGQFADLGGAELLAELGGLSADHLEQVSPAGIAALARAGVVAVMLPGACVQLRMQPPPVAALRAAGVPLAVATDVNPGTSYCEALPVQMWLATTYYGMTVTEAWLGVTSVAARAMGLGQEVGSLAPGALADMVIWDAGSPAEIPYRYGANLVSKVFKSGRLITP